MNALASTNDALLLQYNEMVIDLALGRILLLMYTDPELIATLNPVQLIERGFVDPVSLFIKCEPHSENKRRDGRYRYISSVSLVDQLVERFSCHIQNKAEIDQFMNIPSTPGFGCNGDVPFELHKKVTRLSQGKGVATSDIIGYDNSVTAKELMLDATRRVRLARVKPDSPFARLLYNRTTCLSRAVFADQLGQLYGQLHYGLQKSGSYNTSATNSFIRVALAWLSGATWAVANGDDCMEDPTELGESETPEIRRQRRISAYAAMGHPIKDFTVCDKTQPLEFCSTRISADRYHPSNGTKALYNLLEQPELNPELVTGFLLYARDHPHLREWIAAIKSRIVHDGKCGILSAEKVELLSVVLPSSL